MGRGGTVRKRKWDKEKRSKYPLGGGSEAESKKNHRKHSQEGILLKKDLRRNRLDLRGIMDRGGTKRRGEVPRGEHWLDLGNREGLAGG